MSDYPLSKVIVSASSAAVALAFDAGGTLNSKEEVGHTSGATRPKKGFEAKPGGRAEP